MHIDLEAADPALADLKQKRAELAGSRADLHRQAREASAKLQKLLTRPNGSEQLPAAVARILGEGDDDPDLRTIRLKSAEIQREIADHDRAMDVLERRIATQTVAASRAVCATVKPEYNKAVRAMVDAWIQLGLAVEAYERLKDKFNASGLRWTTLGPMGIRHIGMPSDPNSYFRVFLKDAQEGGFIRNDELPERWRGPALSAGVDTGERLTARAASARRAVERLERRLERADAVGDASVAELARHTPGIVAEDGKVDPGRARAQIKRGLEDELKLARKALAEAERERDAYRKRKGH